MAPTHHYDSHDDERAPADTGEVQPQLKAFFETITRQIADAEARQVQMVRSIEQRLNDLGGANGALKGQSSGPLAAAFGRIEEGMAILSDKINEASAPVPTPPSPLDRVTADLTESMRQRAEAAAALAPPRRVTSGPNALDALAALDSSVAGDAARPWDDNAAAALAELYETGGGDVTRAPDQLEAELRFDGLQTVRTDASGLPATVKTQIDSTWFERRFAEISRHIEASLAQVNSGHTLEVLGERFDLLEDRLAGRFDGLATRADVDDVRAIGGHLAELVEYLEAAQSQLGRLDGIEQQLKDVAENLRGGVVAMPGAGSPSFGDVETLADVAADRVVSRIRESGVAAAPAPQSIGVIDDLRAAIDQLSVDARQGEETTTALLDTLQQAMIRLLDRVDSLETGLSRRSYEAPARGPEARQEAPTAVTPVNAAIEPAQPIGRPEAPAAARPQRVYVSEHIPAPGPAASPAGEARSRTDLIAEARRARIKLAQEGQQAARSDAPVDPHPATGPRLSAVAGAPRDIREPIAGPVIAEPKKRSGKLLVSAIAATLILGLGGAWFSLPGGGPDTASAVATPAIAQSSSAAMASKPPAKKVAPATTVAAPHDAEVLNHDAAVVPPVDAPADAGTEAPAHAPADETSEIQGSSQSILPKEMPAITPSTVSLSGVAVDHPDGTSTGDGVAEAKRTHAIAKMSNSLGVAAARQKPEMAIPDMAALEEAENAETAVAAADHSAANDIVTESLPEPAANDAVVEPVEPQSEGVTALPPAAIGPTSLRVAAAKGLPSAEFEVGARFAEGRGVGQNFKEAARWYQKAASHGLAQAQYRLATLYERGLGVGPDIARARVWYEQAAHQGNVKAMHNLAVLNANSTGGAPDYDSAARWFSEASAYGLADSQFNLAVLYDSGLGVEKNPVEAMKWMTLAAKSGDREAIRRRDMLKGKLDADALKTAEANAKAWRARRSDPMINDPRVAGDAWKRAAALAPASGQDVNSALAADPNLVSF